MENGGLKEGQDSNLGGIRRWLAVGQQKCDRAVSGSCGLRSGRMMMTVWIGIGSEG